MAMEHFTESQQLERAARIAHTALQSPFYQRKYGGQARVDSMQAWRALPVLERKEILTHSYPHSTDMLTQPLQDAIVISTGGSSGMARYTTYTHAEWDAFVSCQSEAMRILGIGADDRVANLFIAGHLWPSFLGLHDCIKRLGAVHLPISTNIPMEEVVSLCRLFEPTVMVSLPTFFVFLADMARRDGLRFPALSMINYAGEHLSRAATEHVRSALGVKRIKAGGYTSADAGIMGYQCEHCAPGVYHVPTSFQFIELINFDEQRPARVGEKAEVVVTNLSRSSTPIIRYRVGDLASWLDATCPCGDRNPLIALAGRSGQDVKLGGGFISLDTFEDCIGAQGEPFSLNFQLEIADVGGQFTLDLAVETAGAVAQSRLDALEQALLAAIPELRVAREKDYLRSFSIRAVELGSLPRSPITGKVARLHDKRVL